MTSQATETELLDTGLFPLLKLLLARTEMMGSFPNNHPFSISGHTYPLTRERLKDTGRHSLCPAHDSQGLPLQDLLSFFPVGLSFEHPLGLPR